MGTTERLTIYFAPGASSMAPQIALHEIGVPFESKPLSLHRKEHRAPDYLAINPEGKVPTLLIDGRPLAEVAAILFYLAKRFPEAKLLPESGIEAEAHAVSWMSFLASTIHPSRREGIERAKAAFAFAEQRLGDKLWALDQYSIVDIHLFRLYWRFANSFEMAHRLFLRLAAHYDRMMARPAVHKTIEIERAIGYELPK